MFVALTVVKERLGNESAVAVPIGVETVAGLADVAVVVATTVVGLGVVTVVAGADVGPSRIFSVRGKVNGLTGVLLAVTGAVDEAAGEAARAIEEASGLLRCVWLASVRGKASRRSLLAGVRGVSAAGPPAPVDKSPDDATGGPS
jgi:hypothetical protein